MLRAILILVVATLALSAAELRCIGVLGNSGEQGATLARYADKREGKHRDGLGAVVDHFGTIWERNGRGRLNRYTLDGRLVGSVAIDDSVTHLDMMALVDDQLVIRLRDRLWRIDVGAAEPEPEAIEQRVEALSRRGHGGRLAALVGEDKRPVWLDPRSGATEAVEPPAQAGELVGVSVLEDGRMLLRAKSKRMWRRAGADWNDGGENTWEIAYQNNGSIFAEDGALWTFAWHGTIKRFTLDLEPDPGVVLGGASGSFIGHLVGNYEVDHPQSIHAVGDGLYLIGGIGGVSHLARWNGESRALDLVRRIGPLDDLAGCLAIDAEGQIRIDKGTWQWTDAPDTPLLNGDGLRGNGQLAQIGGGVIVGSAYVYGSSPAMCFGRPGAELGSTSERWAKEVTFPKGVTGCALVPGTGRTLLRTTATGEAVETEIAGDGKPRKDVATGAVQLTADTDRVTSLARTADDRLLAGTTTAVVELARGGSAGDWVETQRWARVGEHAVVGPVYVHAQGGKLWLSDSGAHRVLCASEDLSTIHASFGGEAGDDLTHCTTPTTVAAHGDRAVVYDAGNQRLLKLELR